MRAGRLLLVLFPVLAGCAVRAPSPSTVAIVSKQGTMPPAAAPAFAACPPLVPEGMTCVPGGSFIRGDDDDPHASPAERIEVSSFFLDVHEVTNAEWSACVAAGDCRRLPRFQGYLGAQQPAVAMRWDEAAAYCARRGARLPTEAEFERAASGPGDTRYPWGDAPGAPCENAIVMTREGRGCGRGVTWPVMSRPAFAFGLHDLAGNVWEWTNDAYAPCYRGCDRACGDACSGRDPRGICGGAADCPESRGLRVVRGGSWWHEIDRAVASARRGVPAENPNPHRFGFRCARDLPR